MTQFIDKGIMVAPLTALIMEINILENSCCIINVIIISKLVLGPGKNLVSSGQQNQSRIFPLKDVKSGNFGIRIEW